MGAWDYKVMTNDSALDLMGELAESKNIKEDICKILHGKNYPEEFLLAVAIVDVSVNGIEKDILGSLYEYEDWFEKISQTDLSDLLDDAIHVIKFVQKNDDIWTKDVKEERRQLLIEIENRLKGKIVSKEEKEKMKMHLVETIHLKLQKLGNKEIEVNNIRMYIADEKKYALADVSYIWHLNAWDKKVHHKDAIFVLVDDEWQSPLFL